MAKNPINPKNFFTPKDTTLTGDYMKKINSGNFKPGDINKFLELGKQAGVPQKQLDKFFKKFANAANKNLNITNKNLKIAGKYGRKLEKAKMQNEFTLKKQKINSLTALGSQAIGEAGALGAQGIGNSGFKQSTLQVNSGASNQNTSYGREDEDSGDANDNVSGGSTPPKGSPK